MSDMFLVPKANISKIKSKRHDNLRSLDVPDLGVMSFTSDLIVGEYEIIPNETVCIIDFGLDGRTAVAVRDADGMQYFSREQFLYLVNTNFGYTDEVKRLAITSLQ